LSRSLAKSLRSYATQPYPVVGTIRGIHLLFVSQRFTKGAALFEQSTRSGRLAASTSLSWPVYIFTDVPTGADQALNRGQSMHRLHNATVLSAADDSNLESSERLAMLFEGSFYGNVGGRHDGVTSSILFDSGASSNFVSPRLLQQLAVSYSSSSATLRLADDSSAPILGKVRLRFKLQSFTGIVSCYVTDLCDEFDMILGNSLMVGHRAVLDYSNFTASLRRHNRLYTLTPRSILTDRGKFPAAQPEAVHVRKPSPSKPLPPRDKAAGRANRADQHAQYTGCFQGLDPKLVLSCAQARKSIKRGCRSFLVLVTQDDVAEATLAVASVTNSSTASTSPSPVAPTASPAAAEPEQADLLQHVDALKQQYADVFAEPSGLPPDRGVEHVIPLLPDSQPPFQRMYRLAPSELQEVQRQVTDLLSKQLIEPSSSPFGAPILFVEHKTGDLRMVVDYRALNKITVKSRYPLPRIDDLFDKLFGAQYFSCLDAASGFHQILLKDEDKPKTAFRTPFGHYQFRVLPFGLTNAPATFQAVMNNLFNPPKFNADGSLNPRHELSDFAIVFIDDILIFSKIADDHKRHIETVLSELRKHQLLLKPSKCVWAQTELPYLGHIIGRDGIKPDPKKF